MPTNLMAAAVALALLGAPAAGGGPAAAVDALYRSHFAQSQSFAETQKRERARFTTSLLVLLDADLAASAGADEVVGLDFDPLTNLQEEAEGYTVGVARVDTAGAVVPVELRVGQERIAVSVHLVRTETAWKVSNIAYPEGDLVATLRQLAQERARR